MDNNERIRVLQARRNSIKGSLASFQIFLSNYTPKDYVQLTMRFQKINSQFQSFDDFHDELDAMDDSEISVSERFAIFESYYQAMSKAQKYISDGTSEARSETANDIKLEQVYPIKIEPPSSPTHSSTTVFSGLEILQSNHQNKHVLISREISWFLNLPKGEDNDYETIENFVNELQRHVQSLSDLGVTVPQEFIIVLVQERFLNSVSREKWENSILLQDDFPTLDQLFKFLSKIAFMSRQQHEAEKQRSEEIASPASPEPPVSRSPEKQVSTKHKEETSLKKTSPVHAIRTKSPEPRSSKRSKFCFACSEGCSHLSRCDTFLMLTPMERMNFINWHRICQICLNKHASACNSTNLCKICGRKHSTFVHVSLW